ncbi:hypothetical protein ACCC88_12230 [Sphingomonas sp. Sphisp140]|uniref:hypothetical protein n=1 Tax=unclassified Sphingomonas TaxID=196159 RepID=UPI0039AE9DF5
MDELLNNRSPDALRVLSLDSYHRLREVERTWEEAHAAGIALSLSFLIQELKAYLARDPIVTHEYAVAWNSVLPRLSNGGDNPREAIEAVRFLASTLAPGYLRKCREYIAAAIKHGKPRNRRSFRLVTENFCAYLLNAGYHPQSIHFRVRSFLFEREMEENLVREVQAFFENFPHNKLHDHFVGIAVSPDLAALLDDREEFKALTKADWPSGWPPHARLELPPGGGLRVYGWHTPALDAVDARNRCEAHLSRLRAVAYTDRPRAKLSWWPAIIAGREEGSATVLRDPQDLIRGGRGSATPTATDRRARFAFVLDRRWTELDQNRLTNALTTYADAFHSESPSSQLLALWSSIEGLLPAPSGSGSRIAAFSHDVVACLEQQAFHRHVKTLHDDLRGFYQNDYVALLQRSESPSGDFVTRLAATFCLAQNAPVQTEIGELVANNPLARQRLRELWEAGQTVGDAWKMLTTRSDKSRWQLQRIYRERNRIVHRASPSANVEGLVLNLNAYILGVFDALLAVGGQAVDSVRLDDIFAHLRIMQEARTRWASANATAAMDGAKLQILLRGHL